MPASPNVPRNRRRRSTVPGGRCSDQHRGAPAAALMEAHFMAPPELPPPASPPVAGLLDALAAYETMRLITEVDASPLLGRQLTIDLLSMETRYVAHSPTVRLCPDE